MGFRIDLGDLPGRIVFILAVAWLVGGLLSVAARGLPSLEPASLGAAARSATIVRQRLVGTTEALVVLVAIDLVVALFVGLQLAYLFGGLDTLDAAGMKYSDYARRGYFELVAAAGPRRRGPGRARVPGRAADPSVSRARSSCSSA